MLRLVVCAALSRERVYVCRYVRMYVFMHACMYVFRLVVCAALSVLRTAIVSRVSETAVVPCACVYLNVDVRVIS